MSQPTQAQRTAANLIQLDDENWRIVDTDRRDGDRRQILGYLARRDEEFEILWMRPRVGVRRTYDTMDAALRAIERRLRELRGSSPT
jgi:hypothetical protein